MKALTVDQIMAFGPCHDYPRERVAALWAGRDSLTAAEIAALEIPDTDRVWALCRWLGEISPTSTRLFACDCADRALSRFAGRDPRSLDEWSWAAAWAWAIWTADMAAATAVDQAADRVWQLAELVRRIEEVAE